MFDNNILFFIFIAAGRVSLISKHVCMLLKPLGKPLLKHEFCEACHVMESLSTVMDQVPDVIRKVHLPYLILIEGTSQIVTSSPIGDCTLKFVVYIPLAEL